MALDIEQETARVRALPCWQGDVEISTLSGGLTNLNFLVVDGNRKLVARIGEDQPMHSVLRFNEIAGLNAAHAINLTPGIVYNEPGVLVIDYVDGKTYAAEDVCSIDNLMRIIQVVRTLHEEAK